ncbi:LOW QUALITY PROTEIN: hypothetical protein TorRG33x02_275260 [Trema orientale]|uniref:Retroviral polymerase SH3-like domain-containing protein n=1 Tax=Trema orientale TaxID=63057 RepID=A0A2P5CS62_TREOI|nr:LOW QUALITY PROTEIN: hypothetical protein TorRG33x02_275260 [Trema orientale]
MELPRGKIVIFLRLPDPSTSNVPKFFWCDAILTATYLINRMPSRVLNYETPLNTFVKFFPQTRLFTSLPLKVFGCISFVHNHSPNRTKLDPKSLKRIFLGYSSTQKGYKCFSQEKQRYFVSKDVTFFENCPFYAKNSLQGKNKNTQEDNFWELALPISSPPHTEVEKINSSSPSYSPQIPSHTEPEKINSLPLAHPKNTEIVSLEKISTEPMMPSNQNNLPTGGESQQQNELIVC